MSRLAGALAIVLLGLAPWAHARSLVLDRAGGGGTVEIRADRIEVTGAGDRVEAVGRVTIAWKGYRLAADRARYVPSQERAVAEGHVRFWDPDGNRLECRRLTLRLDDQTGVVEDGRLWIAREGYQVWGERFERTGERSYRVERGGFTACDGTWPSWRVEADRVEVELEGFLKARGAAFWVEGVPVAYSPYVVFPVILDRRSGFLVPRVGYSDRQGLRWLLRYYWAPADWFDATPRVEYRSRRGWTEGLEVRYRPAEGHEGRADVEHTYDRDDRAHRYTLAVDHDSRFSGGTRLRVRGSYQGDTRYRRDLADTLEQQEARRLETYGLLARDTDRGTPYVLADYYQDLAGSQSETLQILPRAGLVGRESPLLGPLVWEPSAEATRFWRARGERGERLVVDPGVGLDLRAAGVGLTARAGYRQNVYRVEGDTLARGAGRAEGAATAFLWRRYGRWLHTLEPSVRLRWEEAGRGGDVPGFDGKDEFGAREELSGILESRVLGAGDLEPAAGLDLEARRDLRGDRWLPVRIRGFWRPAVRVRLWGDGEWDPAARDPWARWALGLDGRTAAGHRLFGEVRHLKGRAGYVDGGGEVVLGRFTRVQYRNRYSVRDHRTLEEVYGLMVTHPCWELLLTYSRTLRTDEDREERRYFLTLNLKGLGRLGAWKGILP